MLPDELKANYPHIPWREISGFQNILVHNYLGDIDAVAISSVIDQHLQPLQICIQRMLADLSSAK